MKSLNFAVISFVMLCCQAGVQAAEPYYGPRRPHDELPLCLPSWSMQKCRIITFSTFGALISIMLVPTFMMYWKHRQRIAALQTTLSVAQQNRREDALRVMQLAETAPGQLTRAQRAAIEGKIAWRESVSSWRSPSMTPSGSVASSLSEASGIKLGHLSTATTSSSGPRGPGDLEMALPRVTGEREARQNAYDSLIGTQDRHDRKIGEPTGLAARIVPATDRDISRTPKNIASTSTPVVAHARPTVPTDQRVLESQATSQQDLPTRSPITQPTPTKLYGFHLPRPQAGQAYAMQDDGTRETAVPSHGAIPPMPASTSSRQTPLLVQTVDVAAMEPVQLALRSPTRADGNGSRVPPPAIVKHVSAPLVRRSAHIRRSSSASPITSGKSKTPTTVGRPRSRASSLSSSRVAALGIEENIAAVGPSWHRERMKRLQSTSLEDLQKPK